MERILMDEIPRLNFRVEEAYKTLRTNIQFCGEHIKTITFTSCIPNEGKSTVTIQISRAMAELGKKVLFIDADIRGSVMASTYNFRGAIDEMIANEFMTAPVASRYGRIKPIQGLTEYLTGQCELAECLYKSSVDGMDIMVTGLEAPNPSELLGSEKFREMIQTMREVYDYVFIDCPPLGLVTDAALVAGICDGAILVIESESISYKIAQRIKKQLESSKCRVLGAVLNKVPVKESGYGKRYEKYYNHYSKGKRK